jgi:hypothetical protein
MKVMLWLILLSSVVFIFSLMGVNTRTIMDQIYIGMQSGVASVIFTVCVAGLYVGK